jgi:uncharacterized low-complexity protein
MSRVVILAVIVSVASPAAVVAGKKKEKKHEAETVIVFTKDDRAAARVYFEGKHGKGKCPPGLAKKNNGCLPPGHAKKRYVVGQKLPKDVVFEEPPVELTVKIRPAPAGYRYVMLDGDLVKLAVGTMLVVDAIDGLVQ